MESPVLILCDFCLWRDHGQMIRARRLIENFSRLGLSGRVIHTGCQDTHHDSDQLGTFNVVQTDGFLRQPLEAIKGERRRLDAVKDFVGVSERPVAYIFSPISPLVSRIGVEPHPAFLSLCLRRIPIVLDVGGTAAMATAPPWARRILLAEDSLHTFVATRVIFADQELLRHYPMSVQSKSVVVTNSVDTDLFSPSSSPDDGRTVTFVGRLSQERGIRVFMEAVDLVKAHVRWVVVGEGVLRAEVNRWAEKRSNVQVLGGVSHRDMPDVYRRSTVVVNPMLLDGIGNVTLEAMSCARCVIKSADSLSAQNDPIIVDGVDGLLASKGNAMELAAKITWLLMNPARRRDLGAAARRKVLERHTPEYEAMKIVSVIQDVARRRYRGVGT